MVDANGRTVAASIPQQNGQGMLLIKYTVDGKNYTNHYLYGEPPFDMKQYKKLLEKTGIYDLKNYTVK